jgi:hypothetical protein
MDKQGKKPKEDKEKGRDPLNISRRAFLKGMGTSAIATSIAASPLSLPSSAEAAPPPAVKEAWIQINVNDKIHRLKVKSHWTLLDVLRKKIGLTGTKKFCDRGSCGACTVIMDGKAVYACSRLASRPITKRLTIEGLLQGEKFTRFRRLFGNMMGCSAVSALRARSCQSRLCWTKTTIPPQRISRKAFRVISADAQPIPKS